MDTSQNSESKDFLSSFTILCNHIYSYKAKINDFNGHSIKSFRNKYSSDYSILCQYFESSFSNEDYFNMNNFYQFMVILYQKFESDFMNVNDEFHLNADIYPVFRCVDLILDSHFIKIVCKNKELDSKIKTILLSIQFRAKMKFAKGNKNYDLDGFPSILIDNNSSCGSNNAIINNKNDQANPTSNSSNDHCNNNSNTTSNISSFIDSSSQILQSNQFLALTNMITNLQFELNKLKSNKVSFQTNNNTICLDKNSDDKSNDLIIKEINKLKIQFKNTYSKLKRFESHINYFNNYKSHKLVPPALFFNKFPEPFLPSNKDFVTEYNSLIQQFQMDCMSLCIKHLENMLENDIKIKLNQIKKDLTSLDNNGDEIISQLAEKIDSEMTEYFFNKDAKFKRLVFKEFIPKKLSSSFTNPLYDLRDGKRHSNKFLNNKKFKHFQFKSSNATSGSDNVDFLDSSKTSVHQNSRNSSVFQSHNSSFKRSEKSNKNNLNKSYDIRNNNYNSSTTNNSFNSSITNRAQYFNKSSSHPNYQNNFSNKQYSVKNRNHLNQQQANQQQANQQQFQRRKHTNNENFRKRRNTRGQS